ncbi:MAG: methylated-DNA--[protein]-cysteine S-methyltransferase [Campylobacteraceae bacterium]|jgi:methylated-DNA-[protein]-cysteine S-methyltransferase|nr:methylated-DNA--[protein]-cysteine S-methyltransferase [Campylobacteraceae bacterium]
MIYTYFIKTPIGLMRAAEREGALTGLWFEGQKHYPNTDGWIEKESELFEALRVWLERYFKGAAEDVTLPISLEGTPFQRDVWRLLRQIPYAQSVTYAQIVNRLKREKNLFKMSARAVGSAIGRNPLSILVPCHRVLGKNNALTGYAAGVDKKLFLLRLEGAEI